MTEWIPTLQRFLDLHLIDPAPLMKALTRIGGPGVVQTAPDQRICAKGDVADCFWLILEGVVTVKDGREHIADRSAGELIGEQAFLLARTPNGGAARRTADLIAHDLGSLLRFDSALIERFDPVERSLWFELLANVLNEKLTQATARRAQLSSKIVNQLDLLERFCDRTALGTVQAVLKGNGKPIRRDAVVWFSDIVGFSTWSSDRDPNDVAEITKRLMGLQMDRIRAVGGEIDKLMGDGLMAYWFCEGEHRKGVYERAYRCAMEIDEEFQKTVRGTEFEQLSVRIGLHCGPVSFGDFGTNERIAVTILGKTVNRGSRYEQIHDPALGRIRISPELRARVLETAPQLAGGLAGPLTFQAKSEQIEVYSNRGETHGLE